MEIIRGGKMIRGFFIMASLLVFIMFTSGCALFNTALAAGAAYGISQLFGD